MRKPLDAKELTALISARHFRALRDALAGKNEVDIAQFLSRLSPEQAVLAFRTLPKDDVSDVFSELDSEMQQAIISSATDTELADIIEDLATDDVVDMLEEMPGKYRQTRVEKRASRHPRAYQPVSEISGRLCRKYDDGRVYRPSRRYDSFRSNPPHPPHR